MYVLMKWSVETERYCRTTTCFPLSLTSPGLKHVSEDQKTHKNPNLRGQSGPVRTGPKPFSSPTPKPAASATPTRTLPPVMELDGKKWKVVSCWFTLKSDIKLLIFIANLLY